MSHLVWVHSDPLGPTLCHVGCFVDMESHCLCFHLPVCSRRRTLQSESCSGSPDPLAFPGQGRWTGLGAWGRKRGSQSCWTQLGAWGQKRGSQSHWPRLGAWDGEGDPRAAGLDSGRGDGKGAPRGRGPEGASPRLLPLPPHTGQATQAQTGTNHLEGPALSVLGDWGQGMDWTETRTQQHRASVLWGLSRCPQLLPKGETEGGVSPAPHAGGRGKRRGLGGALSRAHGPTQVPRRAASRPLRPSLEAETQ